MPGSSNLLRRTPPTRPTTNWCGMRCSTLVLRRQTARRRPALSACTPTTAGPSTTPTAAISSAGMWESAPSFIPKRSRRSCSAPKTAAGFTPLKSTRRTSGATSTPPPSRCATTPTSTTWTPTPTTRWQAPASGSGHPPRFSPSRRRGILSTSSYIWKVRQSGTAG